MAEKQEDYIEVEGEQVMKPLQLGGWAEHKIHSNGELAKSASRSSKQQAVVITAPLAVC